MSATVIHPKAVARCALLIGALIVMLVLAPPPAHAALDMSVQPVLADPVTVGDSGMGGVLQITNLSTAPDGPLTICNAGDAAPCSGDGITVLASCGAAPEGSCTSADPDVLSLNRNAVGVAGTCMGIPFTLTALASSGAFRAVPPAGVNIVLPMNGSVCHIAFTFDVSKLPSVDADSAAPETQTLQVGAAAARDEAGMAISPRQTDITTVFAGPPAAAAPPVPLVTHSNPNSPSGDNTPAIAGSAAAGSTVRLYTSDGCAGAAAAQGSAAAFESPGITVSVANNSTTTFRAAAVNADGPSSCSPTSVTYMERSTLPPAPTVSGTDPPSPSTNNTPKVKGSAAAQTTVLIFTNASCSGTPVASGSAAEFASPGIAVAVADKSSTAFYAAVHNGSDMSACSTSYALYTENSPDLLPVVVGPAPPTFTATDPQSPANENDPRIQGRAGAGTTVRLYTNPACTGITAAEGSAAVFASPGLTARVPDDSTTRLYANARDGLGIVSACSSSTITYVEDSTAPETAIDSGPSGAIAPGASLTFTFSASEPGSTFACGVQPKQGVRPCTSPFTYRPSGRPSDRNTRFEVRATDRAGNIDPTWAVRRFNEVSAPPADCPLRVLPLEGSSAANTMTASARGDILLARGGNDVLRGRGGRDCLYGEAGADRLSGGGRDDRLSGGSGNDRLDGGRGNDRMTGDAGDDRLSDRSGRDSFSGGAGNDSINARDSSLGGRRVRDTVRCGTGPRDAALVDMVDSVSRDCERVARR